MFLPNCAQADARAPFYDIGEIRLASLRKLAAVLSALRAKESNVER